MRVRIFEYINFKTTAWLYSLYSRFHMKTKNLCPFSFLPLFPFKMISIGV